MKDIVIERYCDGWCVKIDDKQFYYNHNDEDQGVLKISDLLEYLGYSVAVEEVY
jgi:hypothetical protein